MGQRSADWYADPVTVGAARYWDGRGWTDLVSWGGATRHDPTPLPEVERRAALAEAEIVSDYLADAVQRAVVSTVVGNRLRLDVEQRVLWGPTPPSVPDRSAAGRSQPVAVTSEPTPDRLRAAETRSVRHPDVVVEIPADADSVVVRSRVQRALVDADEVAAALDYLRSTDDVRDELEAVIAETAGWVDLRGEPVGRVLGAQRQPTPSSTAAADPAHAARVALAPPTPVVGPVLPPPALPARAEAPASSTAPVGHLGPDSVTSVPVAFGRLDQWWNEARHAVRTDLALHGLAYLGVLLLFAGVTGLISFSFGDVAPWVRTLAELMVPTALFVSAWYLQRRGASVVGASLTLLGGAITPIVVAASFTDGAPFPPDLSGRALPIVQGAAVALVAIALGFVVRCSPSSPLRFVVGPTLWMAAGLAAAVGRDPIPAGYDTARPDSFQLAVVLAAVTTTVLLCSWHRVPAALANATRLVALPTAAVVYVIEIVLAGDEGWPLASTIVVGLGALLLLELLTERLSAAGTSVLQFVVVAVTAARLSAVAAPEWVAMGAAVVLLALLEYVGWRRPVGTATLVGLAFSGSAFALTLTESAPAAAAFGLLMVWGLWRYLVPAEWLPRVDDVGVVPALAATVTTGALWGLIEPGPAVVATGAVVLAIAVAGRLWRPVAADALWRWFVPAAAGAVAVISMFQPWGQLPVEIAVASAMSAAAFVLSALPIAAKAWVTSAAAAWSLANAAEAVGLGRDAQGVALAAAALALVVGSLLVARPVCVHLAAIGHVAGLAALAVPTWPGWVATSVVAAATAGWWATTIADERGEAVHLATLSATTSLGPDSSEPDRADPPDPFSEVAPVASLLGLWATVLLAVDAAGWIALDDPWMAALSAGVALVGACVVRATPWRRARRVVLAWVTLVGAAAAALVAIAAVGSDREHWSPALALALGLALVVVTAPPRPLGFTWVAWVGGAALTVFVLDRLGLDRDWIDVALAGWGAVALLVGLGVQRARYGPVPTGTFVRDPLLLPPTVIGTTAFVAGGTLGLGAGTGTGIGWTAAGMSAVVLAAAMLLPLGALVALTEALATASYVLLAPWEPLDRPWTFVPWVLLLLGASLATRRPGDWSPARWDLPSFLVAHGVAGLALVAAVESDTVVATYAGFGAVAVVVAMVLRRWPWAAAAAALVLVAGLDAGNGWLALVLVIEGVALTVAGLLRTHGVRWALLTAGAGAIIGAWFDLAAWQSWAASTVFYAAVPSFAAVALLAATGLRSTRVPRELAGVWAIAGSVVMVGTAGFGLDQVARRPGGLILAGSLLTLAIAAALTAVVVGAGMRWVAAALAATAWAPAAWGLNISDTLATLTGTAVALAVLTASLVVHGRQPRSTWLHPGAFYASATQIAAAIVALGALPDRDLVIVVLLALSAELVALGMLSQRSELYVFAPVPACGAWLLYAGEALAGSANWFTMPIGLTMLVMVGLVRWIRRGRGGNPTAYDIIVIEFVGMSFLIASALARTLAGHLWNGVLAIAVGAVVAAWGVVTRVRWRAGFGSASVLLATVLLIGVPLSKSVTWTGPALWLTLSLIGIAAIAVASALERGRERVGQIYQRVDQMTAGWERIPLGGPQDDDSDPERTGDETGSDAVRRSESISG